MGVSTRRTAELGESSFTRSSRSCACRRDESGGHLPPHSVTQLEEHMRSTTSIVFSLALLSLPVTAAAGVHVLSDARDPNRTLFPSDEFTVVDFHQNTLRRVHLPKRDCTAQPVACEDIDVLNTL